MLVGREVERARVDLLLTEALAGRSGGLVLRGEAGIGKSALCSYAAEQAEGMIVLRARGVETESDLAFSGLAELLEPALRFLEEIPLPQAAALAGALAIGPPVPGDRFAICAGTLSLLAAVADDNPLLAIVDDAHWLDRSSAEALLFASRRLSAEDIALVLVVRDGYPSLFGQSELPELRLSRLDQDAAGTLLRSRVEVQIAPEVAERVLVAAAGNPLALIEIPSVLSDAQLSGTEPISEELSSSATVEHAFLRHIEALPEESRSALLVAAASESGELESITRALVAFDLDPRALAAVETVGLTSVDGGRLQFRHTLLRKTVYTTASPGERRAAHQALAEAAGAGQHTDGRAWHLAAAALAHDEGAAAALEEAALGARRRGGHAEAASAFERAADLSADEAERARRLREAASDDWLVGRVEKARRLLADALSCAHGPIARARIQHLRAAVEMWHGSPAAASELLTAEAEKIETLDPSRAARMLTDGAWACFMAAEIDSGLATARRACTVAAGVGGGAETLPKGVLGIALMLGGDSQLAVPLFADYLRLLEQAKLEESVSRAFRPDGLVLTWFEQYEQAREVLTRTIDGARARSALGALPFALAMLSDVDFRTGRWVSAYAGASEAVRIADETGQTASLAFSLACLARVEAAQGREDACRAHAARALEIGHPQIGAVAAFVSSALGLLELGLGRSEQAIAHLESLAQRVAARGLREPAVIQWAPDLIEAYVRVGRRRDAERMLEEFEHAAHAGERTWALAAAARCRLLVAGDDRFEAEFSRASELHDGPSTPFELARTELCLGERRRRARRPSDAREPLIAALEIFERLGAVPWAERARAELAASGQTAGPGSASALEQLTPQELQVALVVARGATNKETGAALFLSAKTIETHLGRIYRKLGVRSRTELARLLATEGALVEAAA